MQGIPIEECVQIIEVSLQCTRQEAASLPNQNDYLRKLHWNAVPFPGTSDECINYSRIGEFNCRF